MYRNIAGWLRLWIYIIIKIIEKWEFYELKRSIKFNIQSNMQI
jgi:hypothetical protein